MNGLSRTTRRRGVALVVTMMLIVLLVAVTARLARTAAVESIRAGRTGGSLQHELAVDSLLRWSAIELAAESEVARELERSGRTEIAIAVGDCRMSGVIVSDAAKFNVAAFAGEKDRGLLERKLEALGRRLELPPVRIDLRPVQSRGSRGGGGPRYRWYDQLFRNPVPETIHSWREQQTAGNEGSAGLAWSDVVTLFGDGRVDVRYAHPEVLRIAIEDLDPGAAQAIAEQRTRNEKASEGGKALNGLRAPVRRRVEARLGEQINRYAITIETAVNADRRRWYVVASIAGGRVEQVCYRGQIRW
ncbi:MAG: hypothetical protein GY842_01700 [bacterium]|nr:hypothetical protein [bacterium]